MFLKNSCQTQAFNDTHVGQSLESGSSVDPHCQLQNPWGPGQNAHSLTRSLSSIVSLLGREGVSLVGDHEMTESGRPVDLEAQRRSAGNLRLRDRGHVGSLANHPLPLHCL